MAAGELAADARHRIDRAIRAAEQACRFEFSVFVGRAEGAPREYAERLHASLVAPDRSVLVLLDQSQRALEVVTGLEVRRTLTDDEVRLALVAMQPVLAEGDLVMALERGIGLLAEHARPQRTLHAG